MDSDFHDLSSQEQNYKKELFELADKTENILNLLVVNTTPKGSFDDMLSTPEQKYHYSKLPQSLDLCGSLLDLLHNKQDLSLRELNELLIEANYVIQEQMKASGNKVAQVLTLAQDIINLPFSQKKQQTMPDITLAEHKAFQQLPARERNRCKDHDIETLEDLTSLEEDLSVDKKQHYLGGYPIGKMTLWRLQHYIKRMSNRS